METSETARVADPTPPPSHPSSVDVAPVTVGRAPPGHRPGHAVRWALIGIVGLLTLVFSVWWVINALRTVSTDDAYVNGHVTFVAARVPGQVARVLVDDNNRVRKGDLLVQLDAEPYRVQLEIARAAAAAAEADVVQAEAQTRATIGLARSARFALDHAIEDVNNQVALLHSKVATLNSKRATLTKTQADLARAEPLLGTGAVSKEDLDTRREAMLVAQAQVEEAVQGAYQVRVSLGLPPKPASGDDLGLVPDDLDQNFSSVRQAEATLMQAASQLGVADSFNKSPKQLIADFYKRDPDGNIDRIYEQLLKTAPNIRQSQTRLAQAKRAVDQAELNLRYCDVRAEIDGVVTRRNVNPGNNIIAGQSVMAVRSLTEIWVDANFKETQLARLRIGQPVDLDVDMYGSHQRFKGRISGFTFGTGSTLALLPAENATGNFVKVVQRLPVRIELVDYDPDHVPLFIGLSVTPSVRINEEPTGPNAGKVLQPNEASATATAATAATAATVASSTQASSTSQPTP